MESEENKKEKINEDIIPPFFRNMGAKALLEFDYEINKVRLDSVENLNTKMYIVDKHNPKEMKIVNYNDYRDKLVDLYAINNPGKVEKPSFSKAFFLKRLVSKKKRRLEEGEFDLDMTYVTKRVIAMGFPSTGCETIYRNSLKDITSLFNKRHDNNVKIYNLCVEKERIYSKDLFPLSFVTLFPSKDHNPCPIKLILEFCVDLVLFLINNPISVAAVHCKAGKGRTGVMICSYLVFSGLCASSEEAFKYYAKVRTYDEKGVTIPSQKRYVKYFESFLQTNFCKPYIHMIPQIIKYHIQDKTVNILKNFMHDERYFISPNEFSLNSIKIGPLSYKAKFKMDICNFVYKPIKYKFEQKYDTSIDGKDFYFIFEFLEEVNIDSDIKIKITGDLDFYIWINLWYSTLEIIRTFIEKHHTEIGEDKRQLQQLNFKKRKSEALIHDEMTGITSMKNNKANNNKNKNISNNVKEIELSKVKNKKTRKKSVSYNEKDSERDLKGDNSSNEDDDDDDYNNSDYNNTNINDNEEEDLDVFQIIDSLDHSSDLNKVIEAVNGVNLKKGRPLIEKKKIVISLNSDELDKFEEKNKMKPDFRMDISFNLHDGVTKEKEKDKEK